MDYAETPHLGHSDRRGIELQELTNAMVRLYKELFGRGPTKARTDYAGPDTIITTIQNSLTPAERSMIALDEHQRVREIRMFFQHASERDFADTVEAITGRKVWGICQRHRHRTGHFGRGLLLEANRSGIATP
jgi:uncharacterized protein YbcI